MLEPSVLAAVRSSFHDKQQTTAMIAIRAHFCAAFTVEHQALLADIEQMQA